MIRGIDMLAELRNMPDPAVRYVLGASTYRRARASNRLPVVADLSG